MGASNFTQYLTPKDIADTLNLSYDSALAFVKFSGIPYLRVGRQYRVAPNELRQFLQKNRNIDLSGMQARSGKE